MQILLIGFTSADRTLFTCMIEGLWDQLPRVILVFSRDQAEEHLAVRSVDIIVASAPANVPGDFTGHVVTLKSKQNELPEHQRLTLALEAILGTPTNPGFQFPD